MLERKRSNVGCGSISSIVLVGSVLALLTGCATPLRNVEIKGEAEQVLNRDVGGNSLSIAVRLYQLKGADEFSKLTFDMVASGRSETELLGSDLLENNEVILVPGGVISSSANIREDAKYIGLIAFFRQPDPHYWRFLVDADKVRREGLAYKIRDCYLILAKPKPFPIPGQPIDAPPQCDHNRNSVAGTAAAAKRPSVSARPLTAASASKH